MEYSLAQSLEGHLEISNSQFPQLKSDPAIDRVNPGIGQLVNLYDVMVPIRGHSFHSLEKKPELSESVVIVDDSKVQEGFGETKIESNVLNSFMHPIVTDSIVFPKTEVPKRKTTTVSDSSKSKRAKIEHKFKIE